MSIDHLFCVGVVRPEPSPHTSFGLDVCHIVEDQETCHHHGLLGGVRRGGIVQPSNVYVQLVTGSVIRSQK